MESCEPRRYRRLTVYGDEFANEQVAVESRRRGYCDYEGAWREALSASKAERALRLREELRVRQRDP